MVSQLFDMPLCVTCRSDEVQQVGNDLRKCQACGACMQKHAGTGEWHRLATLYTGKRLTPPKRVRG